MSFILIFETHATSLDNEAGLASGWFDVDLSPAGEDQARQLGERRRDDSLAAIFCSDLTRAIRTVDLAFEGRGIPVTRDARLRECNYGSLTRHHASQVEQRRAHHVYSPFPGGESYQQVAMRVSSWLDDIDLRFDGKTVIAIGHRATFYALEHLLKNKPLPEVVTAEWRWQPGWVYHASITP